LGSSDAQEATKKDLETLGSEYGNNLFVGFWNMGDPRYSEMSKYFKLGHLPAIIITAESSLASTEDTNTSAFVRLDNPILLKDVEGVKQLVRLLYNLFIQQYVVDAIRVAKRANRWARIKDIMKKLNNLFSNAVKKIINTYNIEFEFGGFKAKLVHKQ
jgi:hypothetical protein